MERYFDPKIMDWVEIEEDDCVYDDWFWMDWSDLIGGWDHVSA